MAPTDECRWGGQGARPLRFRWRYREPAALVRRLPRLRPWEQRGETTARRTLHRPHCQRRVPLGHDNLAQGLCSYHSPECYGSIRRQLVPQGVPRSSHSPNDFPLSYREPSNRKCGEGECATIDCAHKHKKTVTAAVTAHPSQGCTSRNRERTTMNFPGSCGSAKYQQATPAYFFLLGSSTGFTYLMPKGPSPVI